ncbi:MAG: amino acid ABC transporter substrate-binding protein [Rhodocyclales bacterium]|nr:amino acid ABC transporter substrate-binding protein [Rhodocyclales bacterium]
MSGLRLARLALTAFLFVCGLAQAGETVYRVAIIGNSPPMSYVDEQGRLTGFNVAMARALCETMHARCELRTTPLDRVVDTVAAGEVDFAVVSLLATPERRAKVLFSKPYYRSLSIWLGRSSSTPGKAGSRVAVVRGSAQARHAEAQEWTLLPVASHAELPPLLAAGKVDAVVVPMSTAVGLMAERSLQPLDLRPTILSDPLLTGDVCISIDPRQPGLKERIDAAIDTVKRDGRYDRINTQFLPFRLQ